MFSRQNSPTAYRSAQGRGDDGHSGRRALPADVAGISKAERMLVSEYARPTQFVPMWVWRNANRSDRIVPIYPVLINGNFEAKAASGFIPHWYYDFGVALARDRRSTRWLSGGALPQQTTGAAIDVVARVGADGLRVSRVRLSGFVTTQGVKVAMKWESSPKLSCSSSTRIGTTSDTTGLARSMGDLPWQKVSREIDIPIENREAIVMIGLFGAFGTASFDDLQLEVLERRPVEAKE